MEKHSRVEPLEPRRLLAAGALDASFGAGGLAIHDFGPGEAEEILFTFPMADGRVVTAGWTIVEDFTAAVTPYHAVVARRNPDGSLDGSFGADGVAVFRSDGNWDGYRLLSAAALADGGVLTFGQLTREGSDPDLTTVFAYALVQVDSAGQVVAETRLDNFPGRLHPFSRMVVQGDGKILLTGTNTNGTDDLADDRAAVARYNAVGSLDTSFGDGGLATASVAFGDIVASTINLRSDGRIVLTARPNDATMRIAVITAGGDIDTGFGGGDGVIDLPTTWKFDQVVPAPDGGFYATAWKAGNPLPLTLVKLTAAGAVDPSFTTTSFPVVVDTFFDDIAVQADGRIVVAANTADYPDRAENIPPERTDPIVGRFNDNGTLDTTFGDGGWFRLVSDQENYSKVFDVTLAPQGIYAAGFADQKSLLMRLDDDDGTDTPGGVLVQLADGTLEIRGTAERDVILLRTAGGNIEVTSNGEVDSFAAADVDRISIVGNAGNDTIDLRDLAVIVTPGSEFPVTVEGNGGKDVLVGHQGRDRILGGPDEDRMHGWSGDDWLSGNAQKDRVGGGAGDDSVLGNGGRDFVDGDVGADTLLGGDQPDTLLGGDGDDSVMGEGSHDRLIGGAGSDFLYGAGGNDTIFAGDGAADEIIGGYAGLDRAEVEAEDDVLAIEEFI